MKSRKSTTAVRFRVLPPFHNNNLGGFWVLRKNLLGQFLATFQVLPCRPLTPTGHLREVADALPRNRFEVFILLAKLCAFTPEEIARAKTLNNGRHSRVILLTARELEPYFIFERTKKECVFTERGHSPEDLAQVTTQIYFQSPAPVSAAQAKPQNAPSSPPPAQR